MEQLRQAQKLLVWCWNMIFNWKHVISVIALTISGIVSLYYGEKELAGVCFGAIASWGLVNGTREIIKNKGEGT